MPLVIEGTAVPYEVEVKGRTAIEEFLADPDGYHAAAKAERDQDDANALHRGLAALSTDQVAAQQRGLGIGDDGVIATGKTGNVTKTDRVRAIVDFHYPGLAGGKELTDAERG